LWTRDFLPRPFCLEIKVNLWRKKGKQLFSKTVVARNSALQINNTHLNRSCCWQHLQEVTKKLSHSRWVDRSKQNSVSSQIRELFKLSTVSFQSLMLRLTKKIKTRIFYVWKYCEDPTVGHLLFTATRLRMNSPVHQTNRFFNGFVSDSVQMTLCVYTKTIFHLRLMPRLRLEDYSTILTSPSTTS